MKLQVSIAVAAGLACTTVAVVYLLCPDLDKVPDYYERNIRGSLFTGFLTVGSFLLSLKAFIVVKLKENIFDTPLYKNRLIEQRKINPNLTLYGPVRRLSFLIFISICSSLTASVSQLTIGLIHCWVATFFCIFVAVFAISMLVSTLLVIKTTLDQWLDYLEDANNKGSPPDTPRPSVCPPEES